MHCLVQVVFEKIVFACLAYLDLLIVLVLLLVKVGKFEEICFPGKLQKKPLNHLWFFSQACVPFSLPRPLDCSEAVEYGDCVDGDPERGVPEGDKVGTVAANKGTVGLLRGLLKVDHGVGSNLKV